MTHHERIPVELSQRLIDAYRTLGDSDEGHDAATTLIVQWIDDGVNDLDWVDLVRQLAQQAAMYRNYVEAVLAVGSN